MDIWHSFGKWDFSEIFLGLGKVSAFRDQRKMCSWQLFFLLHAILNTNKMCGAAATIWGAWGNKQKIVDKVHWYHEWWDQCKQFLDLETLVMWLCLYTWGFLLGFLFVCFVGKNQFPLIQRCTTYKQLNSTDIYSALTMNLNLRIQTWLRHCPWPQGIHSTRIIFLFFSQFCKTNTIVPIWQMG